MVHRELKGVRLREQSHSQILMEIVKANVLVDETGHACLGDFHLPAIIPDTTKPASSNSPLHGGTIPWMSPDLIDPKKFNLQDGRPTKHSDCYGLGMVIYKVLSGRIPFYQHPIYIAVVRVLEGERPERPQGVEGMWFEDDVWKKSWSVAGGPSRGTARGSETYSSV